MRFFYGFILLLLWIGCTPKDEVPEGIIPPDQMTGILIDIYTSEAKVSMLHLSRDSSKVLFQILEQNVYKKHQVDSLTYKKSYEYYLNNLEHMEKIYEAVIDSLSLKERLEES